MGGAPDKDFAPGAAVARAGNLREAGGEVVFAQPEDDAVGLGRVLCLVKQVVVVPVGCKGSRQHGRVGENVAVPEVPVAIIVRASAACIGGRQRVRAVANRVALGPRPRDPKVIREEHADGESAAVEFVQHPAAHDDRVARQDARRVHKRRKLAP